ncbi:MAG: GNAT family N-acetyltransferase [Christensenellales bacterium]|jgi:predicted acetyltransferase
MEHDRSMLTMRQLNIGDLEQFNSLLRYAFQVTNQELASVGWDEDEIMRAKSPMLEQAYVIGWFHRDNLASQIVVYNMQVNIHGRLYPMGGITGVATYPEYAGRGLIHSLMRHCLEYMRQQGQSVSFLYPYSIPFYRKQGWEIVSDKIKYVIKDVQLPKSKPVPGMIERVDIDHADLKAINARYAHQQHGVLLRDQLAWDEYWRWDVDDMVVAIYYDAQEAPQGYIVYYLENDIFNIKEMVSLNSEAEQGLWNYISAHYSMITEVHGANYTGEPMAFLLEDSEIKETIRPYIMARIVDVETFLANFPFQVTFEDVRIHLKLTDPMAPWNQGDWLVSWQDGQTRCQRCQSDVVDHTVQLDIQTLTTLMLGYKRPSYLYKHKRLRAQPYMIALLERLIPMEKPCFADYF